MQKRRLSDGTLVILGRFPDENGCLSVYFPNNPELSGHYPLDGSSVNINGDLIPLED